MPFAFLLAVFFNLSLSLPFPFNLSPAVLRLKKKDIVLSKGFAHFLFFMMLFRSYFALSDVIYVWKKCNNLMKNWSCLKVCNIFRSLSIHNLFCRFMCLECISQQFDCHLSVGGQIYFLPQRTSAADCSFKYFLFDQLTIASQTVLILFSL